MVSFERDPTKNEVNRVKHGVSFEEACEAFLDEHRVLLLDRAHSSQAEERFFLLGNVQGRVLTVRFTMRGQAIRILGAGCWRKGRDLYGRQETRQ
jgi:uncharacterized protein